jgi:hypothetical protein
VWRGVGAACPAVHPLRWRPSPARWGRAAGGTRCCSCSGGAGVSWTTRGLGSGTFSAGASSKAGSPCVVRTSAKVKSSTLSSRLVSNSKRAGLSSRACRRTSSTRLSGSSSARGILPIHQDRDHPDLARQGSLNLQPNEIIGVVKAAPPMRIGDRQPLVTDERQQHITGADRPGDHLDKVITQLDRVDVLEDLPAAEAVCQPVVQPAGRVSGLLSPVADEDPTRRGWRTRTGAASTTG